MGQPALSIAHYEPLAIAQAAPLGSERTRVDTNAIGVDHERLQQHIANWASTLSPAWQKPAAILATFPADVLASLVEMVSSPETIATAGAKPALGAMDKVADGAAAAKALASRVRVDPKAAAENFSLTKPQGVLKGVSIAPQTPEMVTPGYDRYLPSSSGYVAPAPVAPAPVAAPVAVPAAVAPTTAPSLKLNAAEWKEFQRLLGRGVKTPEALQQVMTMRELAARLGGATSEEVAKAAAHRNTTGKW